MGELFTFEWSRDDSQKDYAALFYNDIKFAAYFKQADCWVARIWLPSSLSNWQQQVVDSEADAQKVIEANVRKWLQAFNIDKMEFKGDLS